MIPRFQFSLRTLLIGVALLAVPCVYVAHEAKIVAERKAWLDAHDNNSYSFADQTRWQARSHPRMRPRSSGDGLGIGQSCGFASLKEKAV